MTVEYLSLPELFKLYRERRGLSQRELAVLANLDPSLISKWENELRTPTVANLTHIATLLQLNKFQTQNLINALEDVVAETLALHELVMLYLGQTDLTDAQILERLKESDRNKLRAWRGRKLIPSNGDLDALIQTFGLDDERATKLRSAKPRLNFSANVFAFILLGSEQVPVEQVYELIHKGVEIVIEPN